MTSGDFPALHVTFPVLFFLLFHHLMYYLTKTILIYLYNLTSFDLLMTSGDVTGLHVTFPAHTFDRPHDHLPRMTSISILLQRQARSNTSESSHLLSVHINLMNEPSSPSLLPPSSLGASLVIVSVKWGGACPSR